MKTVYEKNLESLERHFPGMKKLIEEAKEELEFKLNITEEMACDGNHILKIEKDGHMYYLNGKRNSEEAAKVWMQGIGELLPNAPVFMVGVGNYTYLRNLVEETKKQITIVVYEPSLQIFLKFLEQVELEQWMEKHLIIFWVENVFSMDRLDGVLAPILEYEIFSNAKEIVLPNYEKLFPDQTLGFLRKIRDIARRNRTNYNTMDTFSEVVAKNILGNMMHLDKAYKTTQLVEVIPRDIPGIVVAAGPSLNKNIDELKKAKGRAFIIAVDTAIKPLLDKGIIPDMFVIVDGEKPLYLVEREEARKIPMLYTLVASNEVLDYHTGMKFGFNEGFRYAEKIYARVRNKVPFGLLPGGGSVATFAFALLHKIGIKHIILVGQDLALTGNKTHADGTFHEKMEELDTSNCIMVEGNYEEKVPTRLDFLNYLEWYDNYVEGCKNNIKGFRVINATEGGAKIKGTEVMTLKEAVERECVKDVDIGKCLQKLEPIFDKESREWYRGVVEKIPEDFQKLAVEASKAYKLYKKLDKVCENKNIDKKEYVAILRKIERLIASIEGENAYDLVEKTLMKAQFILKNEQFLKEDSIQEEGKEIARKGMLYMKNVKRCAELFDEMMKDILEKKRYLWN